MINFNFIPLYIIILFSILCIFYDIKNRKIPNLIIFFLFFISIIFLILNIKNLNIANVLSIFLSIIISFFLYFTKIWGAADGKILISLSIIFNSLYEYTIFLNFVLNLLMFYSISIIILNFAYTKNKDKIKVIKKINYLEELFLLNILFSIFALIFYFLEIDPSKNIFFYIILFLIIVGIINPIFKKIFKKIELNSQIVINLIFLGLLILYSQKLFLLFFIITYFIRIFINFISKNTQNLKFRKETYSSPFTVYIFLSAIFTIISLKSIIEIIVKFF